MELTTTSNIIIGLILVIIFIYVLLGSYLNRVRKSLLSEWAFVLLSIRKREDMLPLIIERMKILKVEFDENEILKTRWESESISELSTEKSTKESNLNQVISSFISTVEKHPALKKDSTLANQIKELKDFTKTLNNDLEKFNNKIRKFNKLASSILSIPLHFSKLVNPLPEADFLA